MLMRMLRGSDWSELAALLSPSVIGAIDRMALISQIGTLARQYTGRGGFADAVAATSEILAESGLPIILDPGASPPASTVAHPHQGDLLLELYFRQILHGQSALLDLRRSRFFMLGTRLIWLPSPLFYRWSPDFGEDLRAMYRGFYDGDEQRYVGALRRLGLESCRDALDAHFGPSQESVQFRLADFRTSIGAIFSSRRPGQTKAAPELFSFGIGLVCLYEHLESLGGSYDASAAFHRATRRGRGASS